MRIPPTHLVLLVLCACAAPRIGLAAPVDCDPKSGAPNAVAITCAALGQGDTPPSQAAIDLANQAKAEFAARDFAAARDDFGRAIALAPGVVEWRWHRAMTHIANPPADWSAAQAELEAAIAAAPDNGITRVLLGTLLADMEQADAGLVHLDRGVELLADTPRAGSFARGARCWVRATVNRDLDGALADCDARLCTAPDDANALNSRAFVHFRRGEWRDAVADDDRALALSVDEPSSYYIRGLAKLRLGDTAGANTDLAIAHAREPRIAARYAEYGVAAPAEAVAEPE